MNWELRNTELADTHLNDYPGSSRVKKFYDQLQLHLFSFLLITPTTKCRHFLDIMLIAGMTHGKCMERQCSD